MASVQSERAADETMARVVHELAQSPNFRLVSTDPDERRLWRDHDLASMVENRMGLAIDPDRLEDDQRRDLWARATLDERPGTWHSEYFEPYWLVTGGKRVGTVAIAKSLLGRSFLGISSLYIACEHRGQSHAARALDALDAASIAAGLSGIRLSTDWSWQRAVRFYLKLGFWIWGWKRSLDFIRHRDLPPWHVVIEGDQARFVVSRGNRQQTLIEARRVGDRLNWVDTPSVDPPESDQLGWYAPGTFALALAVEGFPLITGDDEWRAQLSQGFSDCGGPEGLAFKIRRFEAWDRKHGWRTPGPRIPGLDYPDWDVVD